MVHAHPAVEHRRPRLARRLRHERAEPAIIAAGVSYRTARPAAAVGPAARGSATETASLSSEKGG